MDPIYTYWPVTDLHWESLLAALEGGRHRPVKGFGGLVNKLLLASINFFSSRIFRGCEQRSSQPGRGKCLKGCLFENQSPTGPPLCAHAQKARAHRIQRLPDEEQTIFLVYSTSAYAQLHRQLHKKSIHLDSKQQWGGEETFWPLRRQPLEVGPDSRPRVLIISPLPEDRIACLHHSPPLVEGRPFECKSDCALRGRRE
ncbi:hypothetical protein IRJ41_022388 [Triplophysa rosa]|uniref:Uncharacterized protein n=1 Tax=Triplophysa rosa TaxID=992332 RepID=A0A9W8CA02_TRIRA|nr:hypothetical protein IRJ41_022388 [Triplophysa rosa]